MSRRILVSLLALSVVILASAASAQLVYVKCCVGKNFVRYCFGPAMTGPLPIGVSRPCRIIYYNRKTCRYGFGPSPKSFLLQEALCSDEYYPDHPDPEDFVCAEWHDSSIELISFCWGRRVNINTYGSDLAVLYDYDGDGDLDLRDFAQFQNEFGQRAESPKRPGRGRPERSLSD